MSHITNTNEENFGNLTSGANVTVSHYSLIMNYGETGELLLVTNALSTPREYVAGDPIKLPAGAADINFTAVAVNDAAIKFFLDSGLAAKTHGVTMLLGTAAMGADGKSNEVASGRGYTRQLVEMTTGTGQAPTD